MKKISDASAIGYLIYAARAQGQISLKLWALCQKYMSNLGR